MWVARLVVPARLRELVGRREFIQSTGTHNLATAKIVAGDLLTMWRRRLLQADSMTSPEELLRIVEGSPVLAAGGYLPMVQAVDAVGLDSALVLREAAAGRCGLFVRCSGVPGFVVGVDVLRQWAGRHRLQGDMVAAAVERDGDIGPLVIPGPREMPAEAMYEEAVGILAVQADDVRGVANALLAGRAAELVALTWSAAGMMFVPAETMVVGADQIEVEARLVEALRARLAAVVTAERVDAARALRLASVRGSAAPASKKGSKRLSEALDAYVRDYLPQKIIDTKEIGYRRAGIQLLIEFMGDARLADVDGDFLRRFRDEHVSRFIEHENRFRAAHGTQSMQGSIEKMDELGLDWPLMSVGARTERMTWIAGMFKWLHSQGWIAEDPAVAIRGLAFQTKAQRVAAEVEDGGGREAFAPAELAAIFKVDWFRTGRCGRTEMEGLKEVRPFQFWLPLLGLHTGARMGELSQLWLDDVRVTEAGTWYIDINRSSADKSLKNPWSARRVPLHSALLNVGFVDWCEHLRAAGFRRVFPELAWGERVRYTKEPIRAHSALFGSLGMDRGGDKVFHALRHTFNSALERMSDVPDTARNRLMGHQAGQDVNKKFYVTDRTPDEAVQIVNRLNYPIPTVARFDVAAGLAAVRAALDRKKGDRKGLEDMGPG